MNDCVYNENMKIDKDEKDSTNKTDDLFPTSVFERLTDSSYDTETPSQTKEEEKESHGTGMLEQLTDPDEEPVKKKEDTAKLSENGSSAYKELLSFIRDLAVCILVVFLLTSFVIRPVQVKGNSMYPELTDASLGFSNVLGYSFGHIKRFDIVIIYVAEKDEYLVKRVIGLPGETVSYQDGLLYINGEHVAEDFLDEKYVSTYNGTFMTDISPITLSDDEYYCLGDNRPHSSDSRYYGPFKKENIKSKGIFIYYPLKSFGVETW